MTERKIKPSSLAIKKLNPLHANTPESNLFFAIISTAIEDMEKAPYRPTIKLSNTIGSSINSEYWQARDYLSSETIPHAELIGLDSEYIRTVMRKVGIHI